MENMKNKKKIIKSIKLNSLLLFHQ